jgi:poly(hydroxyalkanoate) granule-associated protein
MGDEEKKSLQEQARDAVLDVRNEMIVQSANLYLMMRKVLLASLGAMALTADEANEVLDKLVERGELAETDVQKILRDLKIHADQEEAELVKGSDELLKKANSALEGRVETILTRLNVPNKAEIDELSYKISLLSEKVTALNRRNKPPE